MKKIILIIVLLILISWSFFFRHKIISISKEIWRIIWLKIPTAQTIYEKNSNNIYPKTKIEIPKEKWYLIVVYKDNHKLELLKNNILIKQYDVNIKREKQDRSIWEDNQTPEWIFTIETMDVIQFPFWRRWMRLNTVEKAHKIYKENFWETNIKDFEKEYWKLNSDASIRHFNKLNPGQKMLRWIGIHWGWFSIYHDWTQGCVAMSNKNIIELFDILKEWENWEAWVKVIIQD